MAARRLRFGHSPARAGSEAAAAWHAYLAAAPFDALCILGDLFEVWVGDDALTADPAADPEIAFMQHAVAALGVLARRRPVYLMHGNRDFLLGDGFAPPAGCGCWPIRPCSPSVRTGGCSATAMPGAWPTGTIKRFARRCVGQIGKRPSWRGRWPTGWRRRAPCASAASSIKRHSAGRGGAGRCGYRLGRASGRSRGGDGPDPRPHAPARPAPPGRHGPSPGVERLGCRGPAAARLQALSLDRHGGWQVWPLPRATPA